jgi:molybdopterin synthase sulfur carrier subunit
MKITVRYFALLRERAGVHSEVVEWQDPEPCVGRLREFLAARTPSIGNLLLASPLLAAVNREYATPETPLNDGDELALFPPVSGG